MKKLATAIALAVMAASSGAHAADALMDRAKELFKPIPAKPPAIADNPVTAEKVALGKMLYFEPRLSSSQLISCNTCHNLGMGGDDNLESRATRRRCSIRCSTSPSSGTAGRRI